MNKELGNTAAFTTLDAWQEGHNLVILVYQVTKSFPKEETFGLISQMRRAAVSITSNITEGYSRQTYKEKVQFYCISLGSTTELQNQLFIARDVGFIEEDNFLELAKQITKVHKIINGLIKKSKTLIHHS
jgi:four helix bundle protein